jgi:predicted RNase H-like nuclease (RuvC/YqgF family)
MSRLYEITGNILTLQELLESPLDDEDILKDTLEAVQGEYEVKLESYCKVIRNIETDIEAFKMEAKRLSEKAKMLENNRDRLKKAMFDSMKATGTEKVKGQIFTVAIQKNGGKLPLIAADKVDLSKLPDELVKVEKSPDLDGIRNWLETGNAVEGFSLGERGESLRIK